MNGASLTASAVLKYYLPALVWAAAIFVASSIPTADIPRSVIFTQDKLLHLLVYFVFGFLTHRALNNDSAGTWLRSRASLVTVLIVALYGASDEYHQYWVPGRSMDIFDWVADVSGAILFVILAMYLTRRKKPTGTNV